ncbi:hypothetical protein A33Q_3573 [Indibacter alkaliphilus LW1]|uniref:DUF4345 domain-containing protein n=1 Tax=Indibacter alkaliphilus (strain CCUG 57479 / KCTC 22604 / LW1) TaxID=1189612 RepID=S2D2V1_INDAL|nr:DUF4345 domain-containing protein [Indibacter alkaliphilus]EOZ93627.1 hypothetical protein A33Q_3573 [Indibacter alkaliphilus LW1]
MKTTKIIDSMAKGYVIFSVLSLTYVSILGIISPQQVMDMVQVKLTNTDAISSIRGVYGGVGLTISMFLVFLLFNRPDWALSFLVIFWGSYAISRIMTIFLDGGLGDFGSNWLIIESSLFLVGSIILIVRNLVGKTTELLYSVMD